MNKVKILLKNVEFEIIFKPIGSDIISIELERISKNRETINLIELFNQLSDKSFNFLSGTNYKKIAFLFRDNNDNWIDICEWIIKKKVEGVWLVHRHPHSILLDKI